MPRHHAPVLAAISIWLCGCSQTRPAELEPEVGATQSGADSSTGHGSDGDPSGDEDTGAKLDLGPDPEPPGEACASITQTGEIIQHPSDIILVSDNASDRYLVQAQVTNLLPGIESEGVLDANVVHIVDGLAPGPDDADIFPCREGMCCSAWPCFELTSFQGEYRQVEATIPPGTQLATILATMDQWTAILRPNAWKHIWVTTSVAAESGLTNDAFAAQLQAQLDALGTEASYTVHVQRGTQQDLAANAAGYTGLADQTGGFYMLDDLDFGAYQSAVIDGAKGKALACQYTIPEPPDGQHFDRDRVNVIYDDGTGALPIGFVGTLSDCQTVGYGWYYDNAVDPTEIRMCPLSCERFAELDQATIDIQFGCATIPAG